MKWIRIVSCIIITTITLGCSDYVKIQYDSYSDAEMAKLIKNQLVPNGVLPPETTDIVIWINADYNNLHGSANVGLDFSDYLKYALKHDLQLSPEIICDNRTLYRSKDNYLIKFNWKNKTIFWSHK
jgi:hypothetical protein